MNNDLNDTQLENLLRGIAPAAATPTLVQRVDEELKLDMSWLSTRRAAPQRSPRWLTSAGWAAMGAAAAIAVMSYLPQQPGTTTTLATTTTTTTVLPGTTLREWEDAPNDGIHHSRNRMDEKRALVVSRELQTWVDPRYYSAQMTVEIPSQQQLLLPISYR